MVPDIRFDSFNSFPPIKRLETSKLSKESNGPTAFKLSDELFPSLIKAKSLRSLKPGAYECKATEWAVPTSKFKLYSKQKSYDDCFNSSASAERDAVEHPRKAYNFQIGLLMTLESMKPARMNLD